jgi:hypothetical protein
MLDSYRTRQLPQAAFLLASGATFERCEQTTNTKFVDLVFHDPDGSVERLAETYFQGAPCSALKFYRALTELRRAISETNGTLYDKWVSRG